MEYRFYTADVFTDRPFGGNQLAVFPEAEGLDGATMQAIAREFNLSETVFVLPPEDAANTRRLRIFTPGGELPFAGHPTIGTAHVLVAAGEIALEGDETRVVFEEGVGPVRVTIEARNGQAGRAQLWAARMPEVGPTPPPAEAIAEALSLSVEDLLAEERQPQAVSCGVPFLFVSVRSVKAMGRIRVNRDAWERHLAAYWAPQLYVVTEETVLAGSDLHARMFAPAMGIVEDPATGAAATALAGYLSGFSAAGDGTQRWVVEQGIEMGRPSILEVQADTEGGKITAIRVGGTSVMMSEGVMKVPTEV